VGGVDDWWSLIDPEAAMREQFPDAGRLRETERVALGNLYYRPTSEELKALRIERLGSSHERDADSFIERMEQRTGAAAARRHRLDELATAHAVRRREEWVERMKERGLIA
jgi:hypothetical protein